MSTLPTCRASIRKLRGGWATEIKRLARAGQISDLVQAVDFVDAQFHESRVFREYWIGICNGATARGLPVSITKEYIADLFRAQNGLCAISGVPITFSGKGGRKSSGTASLDRIDSLVDYAPGNVWWVHKHINRMKHEFDLTYFLAMCGNVARNAETARAAAMASVKFMGAYESNRRDVADTAFEASPLAVAVKAMAERTRTWSGTATDLLADLNEHTELATKQLKIWPHSAQALGNALDRVGQLLKSHGVHVERRHSGIRTITIAALNQRPETEPHQREECGAVRSVRYFLHRHGSSRFIMAIGAPEEASWRAQNVAGFRAPGTNGDYLFHEAGWIEATQGLDPRAAADAVAAAGFLMRDSQNKRKRAERVGQKTMRVYRVSSSILGEVIDSE